MKKISVSEFASRFHFRVKQHNQRTTWFLGAGCSITSGIEAAGALTRRWVSELYGMQQTDTDAETWAKSEFENYNANEPARHYADVFARRHPAPADRQREIEQICTGREPGYGYATFAQLISHKDVRAYSNTVLTTNFDDLIADALYLFGDRRKRPQIITHEALARYIRPYSERPTIIKLHGDAMFDPQNLEDETEALDEKVIRQLGTVLRDSSIIFVGYGGNDRSICKFLASLSQEGLTHPVYWIGTSTPCDEMSNWLMKNNAFQVELADFDRLMHVLRGEFEIGLMRETDWLGPYRKYTENHEAFEKDLGDTVETGLANALKKGSKVAEESMSDARAYLFRAFLQNKTDPDLADKIYREGLTAHPENAKLLGSYALFQKNVRKDMDAAESLYKRALDADPEHAINLGNYALFQETVRKDMDAAEALYKRAIDADPQHANILGNYALFQQTVHKNMDAAESLYKRALEADPEDAGHLGNCANFQKNVRKDMDAAESFYKRALDADPQEAGNLGNYASLLLGLGRTDKGKDHLARAFESLNPDEPQALMVELNIYRFAHLPDQAAQSLSELKSLFAQGVRSGGWDYSLNVTRAPDDGCTNIDLLADLVKVASYGEDVAVLDRHQMWREAG